MAALSPVRAHLEPAHGSRAQRTAALLWHPIVGGTTMMMMATKGEGPRPSLISSDPKILVGPNTEQEGSPILISDVS